jgi:hypothetical protein
VREELGRKEARNQRRQDRQRLLEWAFSEAALLFVAKCAQGRTMLTRLERKYPKSKALSILAHKLGRAVYFMLARNQAFDLERFTKS